MINWQYFPKSNVIPNHLKNVISVFTDNEGMINSFNACNVTYYTGDSLVVGIDLLFKQSESNIIKIIEKQNKQDLGIANNIYTGTQQPCTNIDS